MQEKVGMAVLAAEGPLMELEGLDYSLVAAVVV